jgi:hypothetical protein
MIQAELFPNDSALQWWDVTTKFDSKACELADHHYSRRKPGSGQFMPPGETIVLVGRGDYPAVFGWHRPHPGTKIRSWNGLDGWTCTIFRNEGGLVSSLLILDAELVIGLLGKTCGPDGLITYVWDDRVNSENPGYCFLCAGWERTGRSADGKKTLLQKPRERIGIRG